MLNATSALIDQAIINNLTINNTLYSKNLELSNNLFVNNDASFNSNIQINGNILDSCGNKGLDGQFLRSTSFGWQWKYLDTSFVSEISFNDLLAKVNIIDASYVNEASFNNLDFSLTKIINDFNDLSSLTQIIDNSLTNVIQDVSIIETNIINIDNSLNIIQDVSIIETTHTLIIQ